MQIYIKKQKKIKKITAYNQEGSPVLYAFFFASRRISVKVLKKRIRPDARFSARPSKEVCTEHRAYD